MNTILRALELELIEHIVPNMAKDEEFHTRYQTNGDLVIEFGVAWYDFILRLIIWIDNYGIQILKVKDIDSNETIYTAELANPQSITNLVKVVVSEWDSYLGRETTVVYI